jgi:DMSO/TMAO reductase YedYZ heme-binding membrane subunit
MTVAKSRMQRNVRNRKQERKIFIIIGVITLALIIILFITST